MSRDRSTACRALCLVPLTQERAASEGSGSDGAATASESRGSWIKRFGRKRSTSTARKGGRGASGGRGGSSDDSDAAPLTSGSSDGEGEGNDGDDEEDGLFLGKRAR